MCSADFPNSWKAWGKQLSCIFSYNSNKNNRKSRILSVAASLELLYFVLAASDPCWFVLAAGYQADVDASWLVFFGLILRVWQSTRLHANYYSSLMLLRDSLTRRDLRADAALSWRFGYQISEVPCNSNCMILWWYVIIILKFVFLPLQFCQEDLIGYWICHTVSPYQGCRYSWINTAISYYHVLCKFSFFSPYFSNGEFCLKWMLWVSPWLGQI